MLWSSEFIPSLGNIQFNRFKFTYFTEQFICLCFFLVDMFSAGGKGTQAFLVRYDECRRVKKLLKILHMQPRHNSPDRWIILQYGIDEGRKGIGLFTVLTDFIFTIESKRGTEMWICFTITLPSWLWELHMQGDRAALLSLSVFWSVLYLQTRTDLKRV